MSISKTPSLVAMPLTKTINQMYFTVSDERPVDMASSYIEMEMTLDTSQNHNVVLGHDGLFYEPSCLFRSSKITKQNGEVVSDLTYVNVLDNNLKHYAKGCNELVSGSVYSGAGHRTPQGDVVSIFNNDYPDQYPTLRVPLSSVHPGSLATMPVVPFGNQDVEFRYLLEPQYPVLMRAVPSGVYDAGSTNIGTTYPFENVNTGTTALYASNLNEVEDFSTGETIVIGGTVGGGSGYDIFIRTIVGAITQDAGATPGHFSINSALSSSQPVSGVEVVKDVNTYELGCKAIESTTSNLTLNTPTPQNVDLYNGTDVNVHYSILTASASLSSTVVDTTLRTKIQSLTLSGSNITAVVLANNITLETNQVAMSIWIEPLYTNLDSNSWSVQSAHLVLYRRNIKAPMGKSIVQAFESINVQCVGGLNRFMYNYKVRPNCYNAWVIQPTNNNLYSVRHDISQSLFSVDEVPLTSIYVNTGSSVAQDNLYRCFANSTVYKLKNLQGNRDTEVQSEIEPVMFCGKLFNAMVKDEENLQSQTEDKNLRVELVAETETEACTVFLFMEMHKEI